MFCTRYQHRDTLWGLGTKWRIDVTGQREHTEKRNKFMISVARIRYPVPFWPLDPGSGMSKISGSGKTIFWIKYLNYLTRIRNLFDPGSGINIPDPQNCLWCRMWTGSWPSREPGGRVRRACRPRPVSGKAAGRREAAGAQPRRPSQDTSSRYGASAPEKLLHNAPGSNMNELPVTH